MVNKYRVAIYLDMCTFRLCDFLAQSRVRYNVQNVPLQSIKYFPPAATRRFLFPERCERQNNAKTQRCKCAVIIRNLARLVRAENTDRAYREWSHEMSTRILNSAIPCWRTKYGIFSHSTTLLGRVDIKYHAFARLCQHEISKYRRSQAIRLFFGERHSRDCPSLWPNFSSEKKKRRKKRRTEWKRATLSRNIVRQRTHCKKRYLLLFVTQRVYFVIEKLLFSAPFRNQRKRPLPRGSVSVPTAESRSRERFTRDRNAKEADTYARLHLNESKQCTLRERTPWTTWTPLRVENSVSNFMWDLEIWRRQWKRRVDGERTLLGWRELIVCQGT